MNNTWGNKVKKYRLLLDFREATIKVQKLCINYKSKRWKTIKIHNDLFEAREHIKSLQDRYGKYYA